MKREHDEVVVVEPEALFLLVEVSVEDDVRHRAGIEVALPEHVDGHCQHVAVVQGLVPELQDLYHIARFRKRHVARRVRPRSS